MSDANALTCLRVRADMKFVPSTELLDPSIRDRLYQRVQSNISDILLS